MHHQQHIADVALEIDPDTGLLVYREVIVVMMRQNGKSELLLPVITHRSMSWPDQRVVYTTNTAGQARQRWEDVHMKRLLSSPFGDMFSVRLQIGQEALLWNNGSSYSPISTTAKTGGTGDTIDLGMIDEAWVHEDSRVEASMRPAMLTRTDPPPQVWITSMVPGPTRAEAIDSAYLRRKIDIGRARIAAGLNTDSCIFYYGAAQGLDPGDPATWWSCMPALGRTIPEAAVRADFEAMELADFTAEYLSWWPDDKSSGWKVIGKGEWELAYDPMSRPSDPVAIAVDVLQDRSLAAIGAAGYRADLLSHVELTGSELAGVDCRPGVGWVIPRLVQIDAHQPCVMVVNDRLLADAAEQAGLEVFRPQVRDVVAWCGGFFDAVAGPHEQSRRLRHPGQPELDEAAQMASKRTAGGGWAWSQNPALTAVSLALGALHTPRIHRVSRAPVSAFVAQGGRARRKTEYDDQGNRVIRMGGGDSDNDRGN